jgi:GT2 family glycosyltransferase
MTADNRCTVVVLTHDRAAELTHALARLRALPERPALVVVDNASHDDTAARVQRDFPEARLVRCRGNLGAAGRNAGVAFVHTPYVAFCDDDTWWAPGALARAADLLDAHPRLGALAARVLVGDTGRTDPTCERMAASPLESRGLPGPALLSFMAGAVVMRVDAFREIGGYDPQLFLGAEELLLGLDFAAAGWRMAYVSEVVTHHHPSPARDRAARRRIEARNRIWIAWLRLPRALALRESRRVLRTLPSAWEALGVLVHALRGMPWVMGERHELPQEVVNLYERVFAVAGTQAPGTSSALAA